MANRLTVLIPCRNEADNIRACIESVRPVADEILVADSLSTDNTLEIVRQLGGCRILEREFVNYSDFKNWAISHVTSPWVLVVDADERLPQKLVEEIRAVLAGENPPFDAYRVCADVFFLGRRVRHCGGRRSSAIRLFRREVCRYGEESVHESIRVETGRVGMLETSLLHYSYRSLTHWMEKQNRYTTLWAEDQHKLGRQATWLDILLRPPLDFLKVYVLRGGFRDGTEGLIRCLSSMSYIFLKYAKLWERNAGVSPPAIHATRSASSIRRRS